MTGFLRKTLDQLFADVPVKVISPAELPDIPITSIALDSRTVVHGALFVAMTGGSVDGHQYIADAVERGAHAVIGTQPVKGLRVPYVQVEDTRAALAYISAAFYGFPARDLTVIGVTGTDGKTTTSNLIYHILIQAGLRTGIISTVNAVIGDEVVDTGLHVTTPEAPDVQRYMSRMATAGLTDVILESTSHGLAQDRVTACEFDIGVVTNISHEHLDYHGTYEAYRAAKARLFTGLAETKKKVRGNPRLAVLNRDDSSFEYLDQVTTVRKVTYSLKEGADIYAGSVSRSGEGMEFEIYGPGFTQLIQTPLIGDFNVSNILAAVSAAVMGLDIDPKIAARGVAELRGVPGRMEYINMGQDFWAVVDFAHTPNALREALKAARKLTRRRVLAIFGSAGLRDRQKRRMMAEVSAELADVTILTAEDPRTESLDDILEEMTGAAVEKGLVKDQNLFVVSDRGDAIRKGINLANPGDLVISCGKGHEQSMCFGEVEYPWDDRVAMRAALAELLGKTGPAMPFLPTSKR